MTNVLSMSNITTMSTTETTKFIGKDNTAEFMVSVELMNISTTAVSVGIIKTPESVGTNTTTDALTSVAMMSSTPTSEGLSEEQLAVLWDLYRVSVPIVFAIISLIGVVGNLLVLIVCTKNKTMKTMNQSLISLLAVTDLVFLLTCVPTTALVYSVVIWPFGAIVCKVTHYLLYTSVYVTISVMCLMSTERFCVIVFPMKRRGIRSRKALLYLSIGIVIFSLTANIPALFIYGIQYGVNNFGENAEFCFHDHYIYLTASFSLSHLFFTCFGIFVYVIPILIIVTTYSAIFYKLVNRKKVSSTNTSTAHIRAAKIILFLQIGFFICYTPIQIMYILEKFTEFFKNLDTYVIGCIVFVLGNILSYVNSCLNPILYTFVSSEYRRTLVSLLKGKNITRSSRNRQ